MRIISIKTIKDFWEKPKYKDSEQALRAWFFEVKKEEWKSPNDVKNKYKNASVVGNGRIVFNVKGNKYRLIVAIRYKFKIVFIRFIGTHSEYDRINEKNI
ncbi:type II toxin-antitoxin system HigB family toxin [Candidatus Parcubacteria bacterium]|nr:type II toxin-antitoxin system HigB family toxin [Candidatus Parcubacteria bacterium]